VTSNKFQVTSKKHGFTLIELLIVITIIGILAVAVLSAINPIEQIRRATDQGKESDAAELLSGMERYYTAFFEYPWDALNQGDPNNDLVSNNLVWIQILIDEGEVKPPFKERDTWGSVRATLAGTVLHLCFVPESKSFKARVDSGGNICLPR